MDGIETLLGKPVEALAGLSGLDDPVFRRIDDVSYLSFRGAGLSLVLPDHRHVDAVQLHAEGHEGYAGFAHPIPGGLSFAMSRAQLRQRLGPPERSGEAMVLPFLGAKPGWDRFAAGAFLLHAEYAEDLLSVRMFTLMPVPGA